MKKSNKGANRGSLKRLKEEISLCFNENDYDGAIEICEKMISLFPKNVYGYVTQIKALTHNYNKYLDQEQLKEVKKVYEKAFELSSKNDGELLKKEFEDYLYDLKEVENLRKIKKDIISKEFLKNVYNDSLTFVNQNITALLSYGKNGLKIKNGYDFINGLFLFCMLLFNLISPNYLLILTIPFGIFGVITMYSFIEMNFFDKGKYKLEKEYYQKINNDATKRVINLKKEIKSAEESLLFLREQKNSSVSKIPELFLLDISDLTINDEKKIADKISSAFVGGDVVKFSFLLENNTNLNTNEITNYIKNELNKEDELSKYVNNKISEKKNNQNEALLMKKIGKHNLIVLLITLFISISSMVILIRNFYEMNLVAFIFSVIVGFISMLIYNVNTGKHSNFTDTFNDNLLSTVFNSTMVYDLIYYKVTNGLSITYGFLQIPIIITLILMGFVMLISLVKYTHLLKRLRS